MKVYLKVFGFISVLSFVNVAQATVMTLDFSSSSSGSSYTETGMTITRLLGEDIKTTGGIWKLNEGTVNTPAVEDSYSFTTGGLFDFLSIDVVHSDSFDPIFWQGFRDNALIAELLFVENISPTASRLLNFTDFINLDRVVMTVGGGLSILGASAPTDPGFDKLRYQASALVVTSVPVSSTIGLMGLGLTLLWRGRYGRSTKLRA